MNHAFCVVDDLIFDASTPYALKLTMESVNWIFDDDDVNIFQALRFNLKVSPEGLKLKERYTRQVTYHWNRDSLPMVTPLPMAPTLRNKTYEVEDGAALTIGNRFVWGWV
jgi:hypothetical protein